MHALVLLSGGQDSTTCLAMALDRYPGQVSAIAFDYGQRHKIELDCARKIAQIADVPFEILDASFINHLSQNALTHTHVKIEQKSGELPSTFVPGRNLFFLSMAAVYAIQRGITVIYTGVCETDYSGYPDCRAEFISSAQQTLNLAMESDLIIETPLMNMTKAQTILKMQELGKLDWYRETHTCYEGVRPPCGQCPACVLRSKGFLQVGVTDPLIVFP
jgi:7-cyano-7-deazaguanine synthase